MTRRAWWALFAGLAIVGGGVIASASSQSGSPSEHASAAEIEYCLLVKSYKTSLGQLAVAAGGDNLAHATALVEQARDGAPPAIKADMDTFATAYVQVAAALESTDSRLDGGGAEDVLRPIQTPAFNAALQRIAAFDKRVCRIG